MNSTQEKEAPKECDCRCKPGLQLNCLVHPWQDPKQRKSMLPSFVDGAVHWKFQDPDVERVVCSAYPLLIAIPDETAARLPLGEEPALAIN